MDYGEPVLSSLAHGIDSLSGSIIYPVSWCLFCYLSCELIFIILGVVSWMVVSLQFLFHMTLILDLSCVLILIIMLYILSYIQRPTWESLPRTNPMSVTVHWEDACLQPCDEPWPTALSSALVGITAPALTVWGAVGCWWCEQLGCSMMQLSVARQWIMENLRSPLLHMASTLSLDLQFIRWADVYCVIHPVRWYLLYWVFLSWMVVSLQFLLHMTLTLDLSCVLMFITLIFYHVVYFFLYSETDLGVASSDKSNVCHCALRGCMSPALRRALANCFVLRSRWDHCPCTVGSWWCEQLGCSMMQLPVARQWIMENLRSPLLYMASTLSLDLQFIRWADIYYVECFFRGLLWTCSFYLVVWTAWV